MGWEWEVDAWTPSGSGYHYVTRYAGTSLIRVALAALAAKRDGIGCIRVTWRPR